jgi:Family of unknown function (DUF6489)
MKINVDIEATPQELRAFFGLPDVEGLQREMVEDVRRKWKAGMEGFDPATLLTPFLPEHLRSFEAMQRSFWKSSAPWSESPRKEERKEKKEERKER